MPEKRIIDFMNEGLSNVDSVSHQERIKDVISVIEEDILVGQADNLKKYPNGKAYVTTLLQCLKQGENAFWDVPLETSSSSSTADSTPHDTTSESN